MKENQKLTQNILKIYKNIINNLTVNCEIFESFIYFFSDNFKHKYYK
jgi:hypothetical protein